MKRFFPILLLFACLLPGLRLDAQKRNADFEYFMRRATGPVLVDGDPADAVWQTAAIATDFHMVLPMDTSVAAVRTEVRMTYDDQHLYLLALCYYPRAGRYTVESMRRDFVFGNNDNFLFFMDPFDDQVNGFTFGVNAAGAQWDGQMYDGGRANLNWDNKWRSAVGHTEAYWSFECAIPFKSIRYKEGNTRWGINFSRLDLMLVEKSSWAPVPRQFPTSSLAFTGVLHWETAPPAPGANISLIPYVAGGISQEPGSEADPNLRAGGDAKVSVTTSLNLDLTVNPDFSQVEVDRQVTNLSRFELFFPERRQFFLENSDLFDNLGYSQVRPFFSRRIGLNSPILYGARLSGKIDRNWRIGVMNMQTRAVDSLGLPAQNFSVAALQRQVFARSSVTAFYIDRESIPHVPEPGAPAYTAYNRVAGLEYNLASANNLWTGKALLSKSFSPGNPAGGWLHAAGLNYNVRRLSLSWQHEYVGQGYRAEVGFVPRNDYFKINPMFNVRFFPGSERLVSHGPGGGSTVYFDRNLQRIENETFAFWEFNWRNQSRASVWVSDDYVYLQQPFDPTNAGGDTLARHTSYQWNAWGTEYNSPSNRLLTYSFASRYGGYFGGTRLNLRGSLGYRFQPYAALALDISYNDISRLPLPQSEATLWLISPRLDLTFTNTLFLTAFVQYNNQQDNINLNVRFQWRYQPASDLFVVYTSNYLPDGLGNKGQALVFKLTYWLNV
ncbi:MAG: hypothetical protein OHK0039_30980 [Bacteroidia bacterium]